MVHPTSVLAPAPHVAQQAIVVALQVVQLVFLLVLFVVAVVTELTHVILIADTAAVAVAEPACVGMNVRMQLLGLQVEVKWDGPLAPAQAVVNEPLFLEPHLSSVQPDQKENQPKDQHLEETAEHSLD